MMEPLPVISPLVAWCLARVRRHIARHGHRLTQGGGQLADLYIGIDEVVAVLGDRGRYDLTAEIGLPPAPEPGAVPVAADSPLARIIERFGLSPLDVALLVAASGASLAVDVARLYAFAWADFATKLPPVSFLAEFVTDRAVDVPAAVARMRADAPLRRNGLLDLQPSERWGAARAAFVHHGVIVPEPVVAMLRGEPPRTPAARVTDALRFDPPTDAIEFLSRLLKATHGPILLVGRPGSGRLQAAYATAGGTGLLVTALAALPFDAEQFGQAVADRLLEARLHDRTPILRLDGWSPAEDDQRWVELDRRLRAHVGPVPLVTERVPPTLGDVPVVRLTAASSPTQRALWLRELGDDGLARRLTARFDVTPGVLLQAVTEARREAGSTGVDDEALIGRVLRRKMKNALDGLADQVITGLGWPDVVLPDDVVDRLHEIRSHARHRSTVFDTWGFRRKMDYGRGLACLFTGPPGTGKTMMAGIIANDLGRELYKVDLSRVVSKWVGETEKNLGRIFDEAEQAQVILFFDEADSLFSARTDVKGANDRFANMEVNYLLQRMEQYDGVSILTTNFERGLDEAFRRRLKFRVHFPMPDAELRAELWQRMIPPEMPVEGDLDFVQLGRKHKMSGGNIKNAVLRAAFYAAEEEGGLSMPRLRRAADAESREMGRL